MRTIHLLAMASTSMVALGCAQPSAQPATSDAAPNSNPPSDHGATSNAAMANPASQFCEEQGGRSIIRTGSDGEQTGHCILPDGTDVEEWAYYHQHHGQGGQHGQVPSGSK